MDRELGLFPHKDMVAPYTDGLVYPTISMPPPQDIIVKIPKQRGQIIAAGIGHTDYIDTNTTWHAVFAGDY